MGSVEELIARVRSELGGRFDAVFTDEDGSARRAADATKIAAAFECEKVAVAAKTGHIASGGALVAVEAVRAGRERVLVFAREADGAFAAFAVERP